MSIDTDTGVPKIPGRGAFPRRKQKTERKMPGAKSDLQILAGKENFAIFQLKGMRGKTVHLAHAHVPATQQQALLNLLASIEQGIKSRQELRRIQREQEKPNG